MDWSAFLGAFLGTLINLVEVGLLVKLSKSIQQMLRQFKDEGKGEKWLE